jgi:hypothetical protein
MPGQTKTIDPGRAFGLLHYQGESMTFEQAKYKYNCYARDVLGLVGELDIPDPATSNLLTQVINLKECPFYMLRNQNGVTIATINADTGEII